MFNRVYISCHSVLICQKCHPQTDRKRERESEKYRVGGGLQPLALTKKWHEVKLSERRGRKRAKRLQLTTLETEEEKKKGRRTSVLHWWRTKPHQVTWELSWKHMGKILQQDDDQSLRLPLGGFTNWEKSLLNMMASIYSLNNEYWTLWH